MGVRHLGMGESIVHVGVCSVRFPRSGWARYAPVCAPCISSERERAGQARSRTARRIIDMTGCLRAAGRWPPLG